MMKKIIKMKKFWIGLGVLVIALFLVTGVEAAASPVMIKPKQCNKNGTRNVLFVLTKKVRIMVGNQNINYTVNQTKILKLDTGQRYSWRTISGSVYPPIKGTFFVKRCPR